MANSSGDVTDKNAYDEYGVPLSPTSASQMVGRFGYTGQAWIPELGLWHYKARFYSPTLGRFMQTDPIGYEDQVNLYAYVGNDPVNMRDPTGMSGSCLGPLDCWRKFIGNVRSLRKAKGNLENAIEGRKERSPTGDVAYGLVDAKVPDFIWRSDAQKSIDAVAVVSQGRVPDAGQGEVDMTDLGRSAMDTLEEAASEADTSVVEFKGGEGGYVQLPNGDRLVAYPSSTSGDQPTIEHQRRKKRGKGFFSVTKYRESEFE